MPPLQRAFALAQINHLAEAVADQLNLDVARALDEFLYVNRRVFETGGGFRLRQLQCASDLVARPHQAHAFAATACRCVEHYGIADLFGSRDGVGNRLKRRRGAGNDRRAGIARGLSRAGL